MAPTLAAPPVELVSWLEARSRELFISVVTVAEIEAGIAKSQREGATRKGSDLANWLEAVLQLYADRILGFDVMDARATGRLIDLARSKGASPSFADIMIAATALQRGLTVMTRNLRHFEPLNVKVLNPFNQLPER